jgi:hypothetical protein
MRRKLGENNPGEPYAWKLACTVRLKVLFAEVFENEISGQKR